MSDSRHEHLIQFAEAAITLAQDTRQYHRKRSRVGAAQRHTDIDHANGQLRAAMKPIRSALGRTPYDPINATTRARHEELRAISRRLQAERRKLWKLRHGGDKKRGPRGGRPPKQKQPQNPDDAGVA
jgi:hypothetical protein